MFVNVFFVGKVFLVVCLLLVDWLFIFLNFVFFFVVVMFRDVDLVEKGVFLVVVVLVIKNYGINSIELVFEDDDFVFFGNLNGIFFNRGKLKLIVNK